MLENLDAFAERINNPVELFNFLNENSMEFGYRSYEVLSLMVSISNHGLSVKDFQHILYHMAGDSLKSALKKLNLRKQGITSNEMLIKYLLEKSDRLYYTKNDVIDLVLNYSTKKWLIATIGKLESLSSGNLKSTLVTFNTNNFKNDNFQSFVKYMIEQSQNKGYSKDEILKLLLAYLNLLKLEDFRNQLVKLSDGYLKNTLESVNISDTTINSESKLIDYLFVQTGSGKSTNADILSLISKLISNNNLQLSLRSITRLATGNLKAFLMTINMDKLGIKTPENLINYLLEQAASHGYLKDDVLKLLTALAQEQMEFRIQPTIEQKKLFEPFVYTITFLLLVLLISFIYFYLKKKNR